MKSIALAPAIGLALSGWTAFLWPAIADDRSGQADLRVPAQAAEEIVPYPTSDRAVGGRRSHDARAAYKLYVESFRGLSTCAASAPAPHPGGGRGRDPARTA